MGIIIRVFYSCGKEPVLRWQRRKHDNVAQCFSTLGLMPSMPTALEVSSWVMQSLKDISLMISDGKWTQEIIVQSMQSLHVWPYLLNNKQYHFFICTYVSITSFKLFSVVLWHDIKWSACKLGEEHINTHPCTNHNLSHLQHAEEQFQ